MAVSDHKMTDGDDVSDDCGLEEPLIEPRERQDASFTQTNDTGLTSSPDEAGPGTAPVVRTVARSAGELQSVTAEWDNQQLWIVLWLVFSVVTLLLSLLVFPLGLLPLFGSSLGIIGSSLYFALRSTRHSIGESVKIIGRLALVAAVINVGFTVLMVLILLTVPCSEEESTEDGVEGEEEVDENYCGRAKTALFLLTSWFGFHGFVSSTVAYNLRSVLKLLSPLSQGVVLDITPEPIPDV